MDNVNYLKIMSWNKFITSSETSIFKINGKSSHDDFFFNKKFFILKILITEDDRWGTLKNFYKEQIGKIQKKIILHLSSLDDKEKCGDRNIINSFCDAGFDLFCPNEFYEKDIKTSFKLPLNIKCAMYSFENNILTPCSYYLFPRSSMGSKTNLRLSNSVGIIDSGYRGIITALIDNLNYFSHSQSSNNPLIIESYSRLFQICSPNMSFPIFPILIEDEENLESTSRGEKGFGSTGA